MVRSFRRGVAGIGTMQCPLEDIGARDPDIDTTAGRTPPTAGAHYVNMTSDIVVDVRDSGLVWITINRAHKHNALGAGLGRQTATPVRQERRRSR